MGFMICEMCGAIVESNPIKLCVGCKIGNAKLREFDNASTKGEQPESCVIEHKDGASCGKASQASDSDRPKRGRGRPRKVKEA